MVDSKSEDQDHPFGESNVYDVAVLGTGIVETMLVASLARVGCKVVQVDNDKIYGGDYSNHTYISLQDRLRSQRLFASSPTIQEYSANRIPLFGSTTLTDIEKVGPVLNFQNEADIAPSRLDRSGHHRHRSGSGSGSSYTLSSLARDGQVSPSNTAPNSRRSSIVGINGSSGEKPPRRTVSANSFSRASLPPKVGGRSPSTGPKNSLQNGSSSNGPDLNDITRWLALLEGRSALRFSIDLMPKLIWSRDDFTHKMRDTIARYLTFIGFSRLVLYSGGRIRPVPCARAEIFTDKQLEMKQKNMLYKFIRVCKDHTQDSRKGPKFIEEQREKNANHCIETFGDLLRSFHLPVHVTESIKHTIAMCPTDVSALEGIERIGTFMSRCSEYKNCVLPFLWPQYGVGELAQAFARMAAVYGAVQILDAGVEALLLSNQATSPTLSPSSTQANTSDLAADNFSSSLNDEAYETQQQQLPIRCTALLTKDNKRIQARRFVVNACYLPRNMISAACDSEHISPKVISRAVIIGEGSVMQDRSVVPLSFPQSLLRRSSGSGDADTFDDDPQQSDSQQVLFGRWRTRSGPVVSMLELPPNSLCCPEGTRLLYLWCDQQQRGATARSVLEPLVNNLYISSSPAAAAAPSTPTHLESSISSVNTSTTSLSSDSYSSEDSSKHDDSNKARLIWSVYFNQLCLEVADDQLHATTLRDLERGNVSGLPENVHITSNARASPDFTSSEMVEAQNLFTKLIEILKADSSSVLAKAVVAKKEAGDTHATENFVFLQKVPDPEDVIIE